MYSHYLCSFYAHRVPIGWYGTLFKYVDLKYNVHLELPM